MRLWLCGGLRFLSEETKPTKRPGSTFDCPRVDLNQVVHYPKTLESGTDTGIPDSHLTFFSDSKFLRPFRGLMGFGFLCSFGVETEEQRPQGKGVAVGAPQFPVRHRATVGQFKRTALGRSQGRAPFLYKDAHQHVVPQ